MSGGATRREEEEEEEGEVGGRGRGRGTVGAPAVKKPSGSGYSVRGERGDKGRSRCVPGMKLTLPAAPSVAPIRGAQAATQSSL